MCTLESLMKFLARSLFIGMITCFHGRPFMIILILSFGLSCKPLITFCTNSIFLLGKFEKVSLILRVSLVMFNTDKGTDCLGEVEACVYNFFCEVLVFFLKYFDNSLTSFCDLAKIGGEREDKKMGLTISFSLLMARVLET